MSLDFPYEKKMDVWLEVCNQQPNLAKLLVQIANDIVKSKNDTVPCPKAAEEVPNLEAEAGIIVLENEQVTFRTSADFLFFNAKRLVDTNTLILEGDSQKLWTKLLELDTEYVSFAPLRHQSSMFLVIASHLYNFNVMKAALKYLNTGDEPDIWGMIGILRYVIPFIDGDHEELKRFLEEIHPRIHGDWAGGDVYNAVEQLATNQPDFALGFVTGLIEDPNSAASAFISSLIVGLSVSKGIRAAHILGSELIKETHVALLRSGIFAISCFNYNTETQDLLFDTITAYKNILKNESRVDILAEVTRGIGNLLKLSDDAISMFEQLAGNERPEVQYVVSEVLFRYSREFHNKEWYISALMKLDGVALTNKGIIKNIDFVLSTMVETNATAVRKFIETWVDKHPIPEAAHALTEIFETMFYTILSKYPGLKLICSTEWLNADDRKFHFHMHYMSSYVELHGVILCHNIPTLNGLSVQDVRFVLYKTLGYVSGIDNICSLVFGLLKKEKVDPEVRDMVITAFDTHIAYNYPRSSRKFLTQVLEHGTDVEKEVASIILQRIDNYDNAIQKLPRINEFHPPESRVTKYQIRKQRHMSQTISSEVHEKSVFLKLVHKVTLKGGRSTFTNVNGESYERVPLVEHSVGMELPQGALLDPVGDAIHRYNWRVYEREED